MTANTLLLTLNAGSSSVKFAVFCARGGLSMLSTRQIEGLGSCASLSASSAAAAAWDTSVNTSQGPIGHAQAVHAVLVWLKQAHPNAPVMAVSHRVVHGGPDHATPTLIVDCLLVMLERLVPLAPLHQPHNLAGGCAARVAFPGATQIACSDIAFHRGHSFVADTYALPRSYYDGGIRRCGFHGLSYEFIARRLRAHDPTLARGRVIVAHLGNGASMCAIRDSRSMASTMGFTALDGLPLGTRCGQLLVFTGGIGENAAQVRAMMLADMAWMGIHIDAQANQHNATTISLPSSSLRALVFKTDEERMLAEHAAELMAL